MPEQQGTAGDGSQTTALDPIEGNAAGTVSPATGTQTAYYAGTYKTKEEVEKGLTEKEATINRLRSERDKARQQAEQLVGKLMARDAPLTETRHPESQPIARPQLDRKTIAALIDEKGGDGVVDVLGQVLDENDAVNERRFSEYRKQTDAVIAEMHKQLLDRDPEMLQYRDKVSELATKLGVDPDQHRDLLLKFAKELSGNSQPARPDLPGMSATTVIPSQQLQSTLDERDAGLLEGSETIGKLTPEERKILAGIKADTAARRRNR